MSCSRSFGAVKTSSSPPTTTTVHWPSSRIDTDRSTNPPIYGGGIPEEAHLRAPRSYGQVPSIRLGSFPGEPGGLHRAGRGTAAASGGLPERAFLGPPPVGRLLGAVFPAARPLNRLCRSNFRGPMGV